MRITRSKMDEVSKLMDSKFNAFKQDILQTLTPLIKSEIKTYFESSRDDPVINAEYIESVKVIREQVAELKSRQEAISSLEVQLDRLEKKFENLEQYTRRPNLRVFGVPIEANERPTDVENKIKDIIGECGVDIDVSSVDRAHRIGRKQTLQGTSFTTQPIIVRFTSFRDRTKLYRKRKII